MVHPVPGDLSILKTDALNVATEAIMPMTVLGISGQEEAVVVEEDPDLQGVDPDPDQDPNPEGAIQEAGAEAVAAVGLRDQEQAEAVAGTK